MPGRLMRGIRENRERGWLADALALARPLRPHWRELADDAARKGGKAGQRALLRRLFQLGVFDEPPLSGEPYAAWRRLAALEEHGTARKEAILPESPDARRAAPFFSLIMPVYDPKPAYLGAALASVRAQTFPDWELCLADDASPDPGVREIILAHAGEDPRIRPVFRAENGHISAASNSALEIARGTWCALLDHDDLLPPDALARMAEAARCAAGIAALFSDEDRVGEGQGETATSPLFKHGFDPDLFLACNCVSHFGLYRADALRGVGGFRPGLEGGQDYDLALRLLLEHGEKAFRHVPGVLYHWRMHPGSTSAGLEAKPYARDAALRARRDYAEACRMRGRGNGRALFEPRPGSGFADVAFLLPDPCPPLSVIILGKGEASLAQREKLAAQDYPDLEILPERESGNDAAARAKGEVLAFLRPGDLPRETAWARKAVAALLREGVGVAGCRAVGGKGFLHHAGYALGRAPLSLAAGLFGPGVTGGESALWLCPAYAGLHEAGPGYYSQAHLLRSVPAVPLQGLFIRRGLFRKLGGLITEAGDLADADLCLRAWFEHGLRSIVVPGADIAAESGMAPRPANGFFLDRWERVLAEETPFQHPSLDWTAGGWRLRPA